MDIGTGIFLSVALATLVALYIATRDRWKWKKIAGRALIGVCTLILGVWGVSTAVGTYNDRVKPAWTFQGLQLSDSKSDVKFKKGAPTEVGGSAWGYAKDNNDWDTVILFKEEDIRAILYAGNCTYCNTLNGINIGSSYDFVVDRLGQPTAVSTSKDGLSRFISFKETNMVVKLERAAVTAFGIYNPRTGPPEFIK